MGQGQEINLKNLQMFPLILLRQTQEPCADASYPESKVSRQQKVKSSRPSLEERLQKLPCEMSQRPGWAAW